MPTSHYANVGKYERKKLLGRGHFGSVYETHDRALQIPRALKVVEVRDPGRLVQKLTEARLLEICRHKHVVEVKEADIASVDGKRCVIIATELISDGSAQDLLEEKFVSPSLAIKIIRESLFGLEHLHDNGVVHCDIKPANILLAPSGAKLSDFGLAVTIQSGQLPANIYTLHMAPETVMGTFGTKSCDIYAMGVTFYRLVNNIGDFSQLAPPQGVRTQIKKGKFPNREGYKYYVSPKIKRIINKAMNVNPSKRYQSAFKFRQSLDKIRINIEWDQITSGLWEGRSNSNNFKISLLMRQQTWCAEFTKNGRRKTKYCKSGFQNNWDAQNFIFKVVAETSIL